MNLPNLWDLPILALNWFSSHWIKWIFNLNAIGKPTGIENAVKMGWPFKEGFPIISNQKSALEVLIMTSENTRKERTEFLRYEKRESILVAVFKDYDKFELDKASTYSRMRNLKKSGFPYDETERALLGWPKE